MVFMGQTDMTTHILLVNGANISGKNHSSQSFYYTPFVNINRSNIAKLLPDFINLFQND